MHADLFEAAMRLPEDERREFAERLLASLPPLAEDEFDVPPEHEAELRAAIEEAEKDGWKGRPWAEVRAEIEARVRQ